MRSPILLITALAAILSLTSCGAGDSRTLGDEEYRSASGGAATVQVVADDEALKTSLPAHARVLSAAHGNLENALQTDQAAPEELGAPLVQPAELAQDPQGAADRADEEAQRRDAAVDKEQERSWFSKILSWGGWAAVGGGALWVARLLGIPGVQFITDPLVRKLGKKWIDPIEQAAAQADTKIRDLSATVESSMAGRAALKALDRLLDDDTKNHLSREIQKLTGGEADSVEDLFRWLAKRDASQKGTGKAVTSMVDEIKDLMPGDLGEIAEGLLAKAADR